MRFTQAALEQLEEVVSHAPERVAGLRPSRDFAQLRGAVKAPEGMDNVHVPEPIREQA